MAHDAEQLQQRWRQGTAGERLGAGAGLGLSIVSRYAELLGAQLSLGPVSGEAGLRVKVSFSYDTTFNLS